MESVLFYNFVALAFQMQYWSHSLVLQHELFLVRYGLDARDTAYSSQIGYFGHYTSNGNVFVLSSVTWINNLVAMWCDQERIFFGKCKLRGAILQVWHGLSGNILDYVT